MPRKKPRKYVSNLINVEQDILPYGMVAIWSSVGSGKNGFIEGVHTDNVNIIGLAEIYRVLLITSRKAKVTETQGRNEKKNNPMLTDIRHLNDVNWDEYENKSVVCTSAHIHARIKKDWFPMSKDSAYWTEFDFIIIDEFHSIVTDASFADSSFMLKCFIDKVYEDCIKGKEISEIKTRMIFLSATPSMTQELITQYPIKQYDFIEQTQYIKPQIINFTYQKEACQQIREALRKGNSVVYYMCMLTELPNLIELGRSAGLSDDQIAFSISDKSMRYELKKKYPNICANQQSVENSLAYNEVLPENIKLFLTNSKNKEGININFSPDLLVVEHHYQCDIEQICGRFRHGVKYVIIPYDADQFRLVDPYDKEIDYQQEHGISAANAYFDMLVQQEKADLQHLSPYAYPELVKFIDFIENQSRFVRFHPFTAQFRLNDCYIAAKADYSRSISDFNRTMEELSHGALVGYASGFYSGVHLTYTAYLNPKEWIELYFRDKGYQFGKTIFTDKESKSLFRDFLLFYKHHPDEKQEYTKLGNLLHFFGCRKESVGKTQQKRFKILKTE